MLNLFTALWKRPSKHPRDDGSIYLLYICALIFKSKRESPQNQVAHGQKGHTVRPSHPGEVVLATCHWDETHVVLLRFWNSVQETHEPIGRRQKLWKHLRGLAMDETKTIKWKMKGGDKETRSEKNSTELRNMAPIVTKESFFSVTAWAIRRIFQARDSENCWEIIN